jgi:hypothetical protein
VQIRFGCGLDSRICGSSLLFLSDQAVVASFADWTRDFFPHFCLTYGLAVGPTHSYVKGPRGCKVAGT